MASNPTSLRAVKAQAVCIDLPGETVQCWRSTDKVQVILKKHRDIIFDLQLGAERKYTVESTGSHFYHADKKKLIAGGGKQRVLFNDGERLHLWVARDFKGELLLKSAGQLMIKIDPRKLDVREYDDLPSTKPDPIVIAIGGHLQRTKVCENGAVPTSKKLPVVMSDETARPMAAPVNEDCPIVCVVDGDMKGAPDHIWKLLEKGGGQSGIAELDPNDIATRNWLLVQLTAAGAFVEDNWAWLKASVDGKTHTGFKLVKAKIHRVKGKARYYFSGYSKYNNVFGPGGFGAGHERVMSIFSGAGKVSTALAATGKGVLGTFKSNAVVSFIFGSVTAVAEWKTDVTKDGYDLAAALILNAVKSILVAALTAVIVSCIVTFIMFVVGASVSVLAVGALTIGIGLVAAYTVDLADKKLGKIVGGEANGGGLSEILANRLRNNLETNWSYLKRKLLWDYEEEPI